MLEYLAFEYCNESGESHAFTLRLDDDGYYYLQTNHGFRGIYICDEDHVKNYRIRVENLRLVTHAIEQMKIYSWRKSYPAGYVPGRLLMGCDNASWSLDYSECDKRITRHIHGKGKLLETFPKPDFLLFFDHLFPDFDFRKWISEENE